MTVRLSKMCIMGIQNINKANSLKVKWYLDHGVELKIIPTNNHPRTVFVDGKQVLVRLDENKERKGNSFSSVWSEDTGIMKIFDGHIKNLWKRPER